MTFLLREPWRTRLLFASVAGNLFSAALIGAYVLRPRSLQGMEGAVEHMTRDLPASDAERFRAVLAREKALQSKAWHRVNQARAELMRSIGRTPYDEAEVRARMADFQQRRAESSRKFGDSLMAAIGTLSPEGRARLADSAERPDGK